ncbi:monofunctional biosynthetic peptidoglycan transglycosylase [Adhaeribacter aquaticus]|uniref:monofunctional biosynthetic peptidoglycan transglycosylase n=1 Tax=Adhaeribacter aquaticus TaxID=299567 RepID=UPI000554AAB6|nr:monofunctional biosynthetic peptidoglycan transglycosylase [Adhaeribacter aquaticus]
MNINPRLIRSLLFRLTLSLFILSIFWVLVYKWLPPPATLHMFSRRAEAGRENEANKYIKYRFVSLEEVSPNMPLAVIAAEDQLFLQHNGFDFEAIQGAFKRNLKSKRIAGGSTISQQVAKNVFLWHGRSYVRKAVEAYFTMLIEVIWGKKRILEVYLNIAETGNQVFGVEAASRLYLHKPAASLTQQEAALIASVLPNPIIYKINHPSEGVLRKRRRVLKGMRQLGGIQHVKDITGKP